MNFLNPQAPVAQKIAHEVVFRHSQGDLYKNVPIF